MSDITALVGLALSPERSTPERVRSLSELRPLLHDEAVVSALMGAARAEASIELRAALLDVLVEVDITRLGDRTAYVDGMAYFASLEPEASLRTRATARLGGLAEGEAIVAATLVSDLDEGVQHACLEALHLTRKSPATVEAVLSYAARAPGANHAALLGLVRELDGPSAQTGLALLLSPWTEDRFQEVVLAELAAFPSLDAATTTAIAGYISLRPSEDLAARALAVLLSKKDVDPRILEGILDQIERSPEHGHLASVFRDRLGSTPDLVDRLAHLVTSTTSARLKLHLMEVLAGARRPEVFMALLRDPNPEVRQAAASWCAAHLTDEVTAALAAAIPDEPVRRVRHMMVAALGRRTGRDVDEGLVAWFDCETDPRIEATLATVLSTIPISDSNRGPILRACRKVLTDPLVDPHVKAAVTQRLRSFAYRDEPELVACLRLLLEQATDIEKVEELHDQLRRLDPDLDAVVPTLLKLFYRFLHHYPREPLHGWLQDFKDAASRLDDVRAQIPYIVRLTGASWLLEGAGAQDRKKALLPAFWEAVQQDAFRGPQRLLDEAYASRTLRKSDLLAIFDRIIDWPGQEALLQQVFTIMRDAKLVTPEIVDRCIQTLVTQPASNATYTVQTFVEHAGPQELGYRQRVVGLFTQEAYSRYCLMDGSPYDVTDVPRTWHDWEWQGWRLMHDGWPIATLYFNLDPRPEMRVLVGSPPAEGVPAVQTIQYLVLKRWWSGGMALEGDDYLALGRLLRATEGVPSMGLLRERALCLFSRRWNEWVTSRRGQPLPDDLRAMAADAYADLCRLHLIYGNQGSERLPKALQGLDLARLAERWPLDRPLLDEAASNLGPGRDEDAAAESLFREFAKAVNDGRREVAIEMIEALLGRYRATEVVRARLPQIEAAQRDLG